jgi:hypothetical protein
VPAARITILAALAAIGVSCRSGPPPAIDPGLAARVPAAATILAGVNLERVRASPLHQQLPGVVLTILESLGAARSVLAASDGTNYLVLTNGDFRQAPPGATLLGPGLAAAGSPDWVRGGIAGRNPLLLHAEPLAATADIWIVAAGNANLPVSGNAENLNRLLHATEYATLRIRLTDQVAIDAEGMCRGPESARRLEETVRSWASLAAAGTAHQSAVSGLLRRIRVSREDRTVHLSLIVATGELEPIFKLF